MLDAFKETGSFKAALNEDEMLGRFDFGVG